MPRARPSIETTLTRRIERSTARATRAEAPRLKPMARRPAATGRPAETRVPKAKNSRREGHGQRAPLRGSAALGAELPEVVVDGGLAGDAESHARETRSQARGQRRGRRPQPGDQPVRPWFRRVEAHHDDGARPVGSHQEGVGLIEVREGASHAGKGLDPGRHLAKHCLPFGLSGPRNAPHHQNHGSREGRLEPRGEGLLHGRRLAAEDPRRHVEALGQTAARAAAGRPRPGPSRR